MEQLIPPPSSQGVTEDEYLRREETSRTRHEFRNGSIVAMAGGTDAHSAIAANLIIEIGTRLKGRPCSPHTSDLRVRVVETGEYVYPDVTVAC
jgi:Uma2 family endonuclease